MPGQAPESILGIKTKWLSWWFSAQKSGGGSTGLLAGVGALVVAAGFALTASGGSKSAPRDLKPNKLKGKVKVSTLCPCDDTQMQP